MRQRRTYYLGILLLSMLPIISDGVVAQIYKWVDADGKLHYGDKPRNPGQARDMQQIELRESYQPAVRTAQEQQLYDEEQRLIRLRDQLRRRDEQQAQEQADARQREKKAELCANYDKAIGELSTVVEKNGIRTMVYLEEDGKSVSAERQREIVEELKVKRAAARCA